MKQEWHECSICSAKMYCSDERFKNHMEDCEYKNGKVVKPVPLDPSIHDCPKCGGSITKAGMVRYCAACEIAVGGGSGVLQ